MQIRDKTLKQCCWREKPKKLQIPCVYIRLETPLFNNLTICTTKSPPPYQFETVTSGTLADSSAALLQSMNKGERNRAGRGSLTTEKRKSKIKRSNKLMTWVVVEKSYTFIGDKVKIIFAPRIKSVHTSISYNHDIVKLFL